VTHPFRGLVVLLAIATSPLWGCGQPSGITASVASPQTTLAPSSSLSAPMTESSMPSASAALESPPSPTQTGRPVARFARDSIIQTISPDVRVRSKPEISTASKKLTPLLPAGTTLFVVRGPVTGDGFDWYLVSPLGDGLPAGWVATGRAGDPWLGRGNIACPATPAHPTALGTILDGDPLLALHCFGRRSFSFDGLLGSYEAQCGVEPCCDVADSRGCLFDAWLIDPRTSFVFSTELPVAFADEIDQAALASFTFEEPIPVRVTGQLDHPFAKGCTPIPGVYDPDQSPALAVLRCRTRFVVTSVKLR